MAGFAAATPTSSSLSVDADLGAQLVEGEPLEEIGPLRLRAVDRIASVLGQNEEVEQDLALGLEKAA